MINADGTVTYAPGPEFSGVDTFTYQICETSAGGVLAFGAILAGELCDIGTVTVTVAAINDAPVWVGLTPPTIVAGSGVALPRLEFEDPEGSAVTVAYVRGDLPAGVTVNSDGSFAGIPEVSGTYVIWVEACDESGACSTISVFLQIGSLPFPDDDPTTDNPSLPFTGMRWLGWLLVAVSLIMGGLVSLVAVRREATAIVQP